MRRQQKRDTERIEAVADDFAIRLGLANAKVFRAALKRPRKKRKPAGHAAS
jgi:hypothetical protein